MKGRLIGVSIGPGDPNMMTLQAKAIIEETAVIAYVKTHRDHALARRIVSEAIPLDEKILLELPFVMVKDPDKRREQYEKNMVVIREHLNQGRDVAMINLGDVSLYSTYSYLDRLAREEGFDTLWIPGVSSITAGACAARTALAEMDQAIHILPGSFIVDEEFDWPGTKVIMKSASAFESLREHLLNRFEDSLLVENVGLSTQRIQPLSDVEESGYFSVIYIRG